MEAHAIINLLCSLSGEYEEEIENLKTMQAMLSNSRFRITNAGPMNPGKSTLFNALLKKKEVFKTADARLTVVCQEEPWGDSFTLIDTPGCNSTVFEDNKESVSAFRKADFIIFVHNINTGGLLSSELDILKSLLACFGKEAFAQRVCIVCNRIDDAPDEGNIERNANEILSQIKENLHTDMKLYCVSPLNYLKGVDCEQEGKKVEAKIFYKSSNMTVLVEAINSAFQNLGKRCPVDFADLVNKLKTTKSVQNTQMKTLQTELSTERKKVRAKWKQTLDDIRPAWDECC